MARNHLVAQYYREYNPLPANSLDQTLGEIVEKSQCVDFSKRWVLESDVDYWFNESRDIADSREVKTL